MKFRKFVIVPFLVGAFLCFISSAMAAGGSRNSKLRVNKPVFTQITTNSQGETWSTPNNLGGLINKVEPVPDMTSLLKTDLQNTT